MKKNIISAKWEYEITKCQGKGLKGYGYNLIIYKNNKIVYNQGGYGVSSLAKSRATDYMLSEEFNIDISNN